MKKPIILFLMFISTIIFLGTGCEKDDGEKEDGRATFYTTKTSNWVLIVDGKERGRITNTTQMPVCGDPDFQTLTLSSGDHTVDARSLDGYAWGHIRTFTVISGECIQIKAPQ